MPRNDELLRLSVYHTPAAKDVAWYMFYGTNNVMGCWWLCSSRGRTGSNFRSAAIPACSAHEQARNRAVLDRKLRLR
jgi:hypothetical protein